MVWVRGAAIRPVPSYAVVGHELLESIERQLARDSNNEARGDLDVAFKRFESTQPHLAATLSEVLAKPLDQTALALGYFLSISIWLAFDRAFGERLGEVSEDAVRATEAALALEEELRASHAEEPFDLDDVVAMEQPGILAFVHEHVEAALDPTAHEGEAKDVDVDDVHRVYRAVLVLTLAMSHAVVPEEGVGGKRDKELLA